MGLRDVNKRGGGEGLRLLSYVSHIDYRKTAGYSAKKGEAIVRGWKLRILGVSLS
jgi:hypothetical protein